MKIKSKMSREEFIKIGSLVFAGSLINEFAFANDTILIHSKNDDQLMQDLVINNDNSVKRIMDKDPLNPNTRSNSFRSVATTIAIMVASLSNSKSKFYRSDAIVEHINHSMDIMLNGQYGDGTLDAGGNRQSPPDTAFVLEPICMSAKILQIIDDHKELKIVKDKLKKFILSAGEAMVVGGVHTPNHRWVICAALARINSLYPDSKYVRRIDQWLAEGIYTNEDGQYPERSGNYSAVIDKEFITIARLLNRPKLLDVVNRNLTTFYYYTEPNGDLVSIDSRRQDQLRSSTVTNFYLQYRYMAIQTNSPIFVYMAKEIESLPDFKERILSHSLIDFMENKELQKELPILKDFSNDFEKFFTGSDLVRIRHGNNTMTLYGGDDKPVQIISGRASNPNFLTYRKGSAILKYMRLSTSFFRMGYFRGDALVKEGRTYKLKETKEAFYYQPMPIGSRNVDGDYKLSPSPDGRYWSKMDFDLREKSNIKKQITTIDVIENDGVLNLDIKVDGPPNVEVVLELCFNEGGELTGTEPATNTNYLLKSGYGTYAFGGDVINFGPGEYEHGNIYSLESEQYGYHHGSLRTDGMHVYLTGYTPFKHKMTIS